MWHTTPGVIKKAPSALAPWAHERGWEANACRRWFAHPTPVHVRFLPRDGGRGETPEAREGRNAGGETESTRKRTGTRRTAEGGYAEGGDFRRAAIWGNTARRIRRRETERRARVLLYAGVSRNHVWGVVDGAAICGATLAQARARAFFLSLFLYLSLARGLVCTRTHPTRATKSP